MKQLLFIIYFIIITMAAGAADLLRGYIVTANGDTIQCQIKGGRFLSNPFNGITIINEQGIEEALPSKEKKIIAFGFVEHLKSYHYLFVDVGEKLENGFYQLLDKGPKYRLYTRPATVYGGNPTYVLYNGQNAFTKFEPCVVCPWKKQLRELLKDDPRSLEQVEKASRVNIPKFVAEINKMGD